MVIEVARANPHSDDYVPKPFSPRHLLAKVYQYLT
jgi:DNA-binding response OmpR family regulator